MCVAAPLVRRPSREYPRKTRGLVLRSSIRDLSPRRPESCRQARAEGATMKRPVIGVIGNTHVVENRFSVQMAGERNLHAVAEVAGALPLIFAGHPGITHIPDLLDTVDGIMLTGARANVHPTRFNTEPSAKHEPYDEARDALALPLITACVERGVPLFGICRGFQEMNVAFGGSLHPAIRELPGRMNHRLPRPEHGD